MQGLIMNYSYYRCIIYKMATVTAETERKIEAYMARPSEEFLSLDSKNMKIDCLNTYRVWAMRWIRDGKSPDFYIRDYQSFLMRDLPVYPRVVLAHLWRMTETPDLEDRLEATVSNISLRSSKKERETSAFLMRLKKDNLVSARQGLEDKRLRVYRVTDKFLASGLLLNSFPKVWVERFESGEIQKELEENFVINPVIVEQPQLF